MEPAIAEKRKLLYYDTKGPESYGAVENQFRSAKKGGLLGVTGEHVEKFLIDQMSYSLHKPARRKFKRNQTCEGYRSSMKARPGRHAGPEL